MPDHIRMFLSLLIGTAGRPEALLQLTRFQCDLGHGTINLNQPGREETKKRRPILPMADWLRPWIEATEGPLVAITGEPGKSRRCIPDAARLPPDFGRDVTAYTLRHTIATQLMVRRVPELEIAALLGHRMPEQPNYRPETSTSRQNASPAPARHSTRSQLKLSRWNPSSDVTPNLRAC